MRTLPQTVTTLAFGAYAALAQVVLLREVMVVLAGNELSLAISLAAWLVGVGIGAAIGGRLAVRKAGPTGLLLLSVILLVVTVPAAVLALRVARLLLDAAPGTVLAPLQAMALCAALLAPAALGVGLSFAPLVRVWSRPSTVYAVEAAGAFAGGLLFTLAFAGRLSSFVVLGVSGALLAAVVGVFFLVRAARPAGGLLCAMALLWGAALLPSLPFSWQRAERWSAEARYRSYAAAGDLVAHRETPYQRLELARQEGQFDLYANGTPQISFPDPYERLGPVHVAMTQTAAPARRVLLLGGGVADRLGAALAHGPDRVDYVSADPGEIDIVRDVLSQEERRLLTHARVRLIHDDGRRFITDGEPGSYDVIIVETADPVTALANRYYTREFHAACARALAPDGILATRVGTTADYGHADVGAPAAVLYQSLSAELGHLALWPGPTMRVYAAAADGVVSDRAEELATRWRARSSDVDGFSEHRFESLFDAGAVAEAHRRLRDLSAVANRDAHPIAYLYGLVLWDQRARGAQATSPLWALRHLRIWWLLLPLVLLALLRLFWPRRAGSRPRDGLWSTVTGGACGLALEVMLLFLFQTSAGSLYATLGVLVALFMVGLTVGTVLSQRRCGALDARGRRRWGAMVDGATICVVATMPLLAGIGPAASWLVGVWLVAAGLCTGAVFPPAVADLRRRWQGEGGVTRAAGLADAADHLGACLGALAIGLLVLPTVGLWGGAAVLAVLKAVSLVGWLRSGEAETFRDQPMR